MRPIHTLGTLRRAPTYITGLPLALLQFPFIYESQLLIFPLYINPVVS
jgi:hypothetical protein